MFHWKTKKIEQNFVKTVDIRKINENIMKNDEKMCLKQVLPQKSNFDGALY